MAAPQNVIALVFDFDDTLTDDSTTALLKQHGIDADDFWTNRTKALIESGWDPAPAYLKLVLDNVGKNRPLGKLTNGALREFGGTLRFYRGLPRLFTDLTADVAKHRASNPTIEFYVISGGLEEIIRGSRIAKHLSGLWGCRFAEERRQIKHVQNVISFTEKTKVLFAINKGLARAGQARGPYAVNEEVLEQNRRIPFSNIIYVGDGLTDVPCFSVVQRFGGKAFGIFDPTNEASPKKAWEKLVTPHRVQSIHAPKYRPTDELGALIRTAVRAICFDLDARVGAVQP